MIEQVARQDNAHKKRPRPQRSFVMAMALFGNGTNVCPALPETLCVISTAPPLLISQFCGFLDFIRLHAKVLLSGFA